MNHLFHHVKRHAKTVGCHVRKHHKKYLLWIFGGFAVTKMLLVFVAGFGLLQYNLSTFASNESGCVMTGQTYVEPVESCTTTVAGYYTGGQEECVVTQEGYYTGGSLDESGNLVNQTYIDPVQSCTLTWQTYIAPVQECTTIPGYRTGGTQVCPEVTGNSWTNLWSSATSGTDGVCWSGDIQRVVPYSGSSLRSTFSFQRNYLDTDCTSGDIQLLTIQLYDHNQQRVSLGTVSSAVTGYSFNSLLLSWVTNQSGLVLSGLYHVLWTGLSGQVIHVYTGVATGAYTNLWTGYRLRLLNAAQTVLITWTTFTIDNIVPVLTGVTLSSSDSVSGYVGLNKQVQLSFAASEVLSWVTVTIWWTWTTVVAINGLNYTYTQILTSWFTQGTIPYTITFSDIAGNTWSIAGVSTLVFDKTAPTVSQLQLTWTTGGVALSFVSSELARFAVSSSLWAWTWTDYTTGHTYVFSGVVANTTYPFRLSVLDMAGNPTMYSGSFIQTATGVTFSYIVYTTSELTWTLALLQQTLKIEVEKFNACKNALNVVALPVTVDKNTYVLQMPDFKKTYIKKVVNAFSLLILDKVEQNKELTQSEIDIITDRFDNFLIIMKLLKDDDNVCKQNLSNYYITQFSRVLTEFNFYLK